MISDRRVLALIPARGGSKGIKNKNIISLCGKPLIAYSIEAAKNSEYVDDVIITTDSEKIAEVSKQYGAEVPFMRPSELAADTSKTIDAVVHAVDTLKNSGRMYDILVLLQPTEPLRTSKDIDNALKKHVESGYKSIASVSEVNDHPILIRSIGQNGELLHLTEQNSTVRRQDMPAYYRINGCIYINEISDINSETSFNDNSFAFVMEQSHSVDIDDPADLALAEYYIKTLNSNDNL